MTFISTGGPTTNVIWTRGSDTVTEGNETVLNDRVTAKYTHTLTENVSTSFPITYSCRVSNDRPSFVILYASIHVSTFSKGMPMSYGLVFLIVNEIFTSYTIALSLAFNNIHVH